jgi:hypothetical protein
LGAAVTPLPYPTHESLERLRQEVGAWELERNERQVEIKWQFTTADTRIKLHRLYPVIQ